MERTEPGRLCRREMAARLGLERNPSSPRPRSRPWPHTFLRPAAAPLQDTALPWPRSNNPTATAPQPLQPPHSHLPTDGQTDRHHLPVAQKVSLVPAGTLNWGQGSAGTE